MFHEVRVQALLILQLQHYLDQGQRVFSSKSPDRSILGLYES